MRDISFSVHDKLRILEILDDLGIAFVEGGWPGANPKDEDFFVEAKKLSLQNTKLTAFGSTRKANTKISEDPILKALLRAETEVVCIVAKSSAWQVINTLKASLNENLTMLKESIEYLKSHDKKVFIDAEHFFDGFKYDAQYAKSFIETTIQAHADRIILCDTNGGSLPEDVFNITKQLVDQYGNQIKFGVHAHNDGELAVANSINAVQAGAIQVQGTINGYGERCGNANLISIIANLQLKYKNFLCVPANKLNKLTGVAKSIAEIANMNLQASQAFVGPRAFTHKGGLHASAIAKDKTSYEHIEPESVGNLTKVVVSDQSGSSNIIDWLNNNNFKLISEEVTKQAAKEILDELKRLEYFGYSFESADASFELLVRKILDKNFKEQIQNTPNLNRLQAVLPKYFELIESNVHVVNGEKTEATVRIKINDIEKHSASIGNGPANALDRALRKALRDHYPEIDNFKLQDFKVRIRDSHLGSAAITKVQVNTGKNPADTSLEVNSWDTIGVSSNIIKASWDAIVESIVFGLIVQGVKCQNHKKTTHA